MQDVQLFDGASRGPYGALAFLLAVRTKFGIGLCCCSCCADSSFRSQASVGAAIVVLMLLFDPFIQQVVTFPDRLVASDTPATTVRAKRFGAHSYEGLPLPSVLDLSMKVIWLESSVRDLSLIH